MIVSAKFRVIIAAILIGVSMIEVALNGFGLFEANEVLVGTQFTLGSLLLGIGLVKKTNRQDNG